MDKYQPHYKELENDLHIVSNLHTIKIQSPVHSTLPECSLPEIGTRLKAKNIISEICDPRFNNNNFEYMSTKKTDLELKIPNYVDPDVYNAHMFDGKNNSEVVQCNSVPEMSLHLNYAVTSPTKKLKLEPHSTISDDLSLKKNSILTGDNVITDSIASFCNNVVSNDSLCSLKETKEDISKINCNTANLSSNSKNIIPIRSSSFTKVATGNNRTSSINYRAKSTTGDIDQCKILNNSKPKSFVKKDILQKKDIGAKPISSRRKTISYDYDLVNEENKSGTNKIPESMTDSSLAKYNLINDSLGFTSRTHKSSIEYKGTTDTIQKSQVSNNSKQQSDRAIERNLSQTIGIGARPVKSRRKTISYDNVHNNDMLNEKKVSLANKISEKLTSSNLSKNELITGRPKSSQTCKTNNKGKQNITEKDSGTSTQKSINLENKNHNELNNEKSKDRRAQSSFEIRSNSKSLKLSKNCSTFELNSLTNNQKIKLDRQSKNNDCLNKPFQSDKKNDSLKWEKVSESKKHKLSNCSISSSSATESDQIKILRTLKDIPDKLEDSQIQNKNNCNNKSIIKSKHKQQKSDEVSEKNEKHLQNSDNSKAKFLTDKMEIGLNESELCLLKTVSSVNDASNQNMEIILQQLHEKDATNQPNSFNQFITANTKVDSLKTSVDTKCSTSHENEIVTTNKHNPKSVPNYVAPDISTKDCDHLIDTNLSMSLVINDLPKTELPTEIQIEFPKIDISEQAELHKSTKKFVDMNIKPLEVSESSSNVVENPEEIEIHLISRKELKRRSKQKTHIGDIDSEHSKICSPLHTTTTTVLNMDIDHELTDAMQKVINKPNYSIISLFNGFETDLKSTLELNTVAEDSGSLISNYQCASTKTNSVPNDIDLFNEITHAESFMNKLPVIEISKISNSSKSSSDKNTIFKNKSIGEDDLLEQAIQSEFNDTGINKSPLLTVETITNDSLENNLNTRTLSEGKDNKNTMDLFASTTEAINAQNKLAIDMENTITDTSRILVNESSDKILKSTGNLTYYIEKDGNEEVMFITRKKKKKKNKN